MGRVIEFADVEHRPGSVRALEPLFLATNLAALLVHAPFVATARVRFREPWEPLTRISRPLIWICWHRYNFACTPAMRALPEALRPTLVMHDGAASRAFTHRSSGWLGFRAFAFRRRSPVPPRVQLIDYVKRTGRPLLNLPDSGGPYGTMKPGILEVARAVDGLLVPFAIAASASLSLGRALRHLVPAPFSTLELRRGDPIEARHATVDDCQRALDALSS
jgi:lysophospholipid acyltransferase (LPLAT)-like uncharacterized protein